VRIAVKDPASNEKIIRAMASVIGGRRQRSTTPQSA
jgi:hypothetical protein